MPTKEQLTEELRKLKEEYEIAVSRMNILKENVTKYEEKALRLDGAIAQTEKILALYNNEESEKEGGEVDVQEKQNQN